jgi:3-methylcrotonyl-CoA carboxylase beta subunit
LQSVLKSHIDPHSAEFARNRADHAALADTLRQRLAWAVSGSREREIRRHLERGKMMVRDRIDRCIDPGSPFLELSSLAAFGQYDDQSPGSGMVTGIGQIHGIPVMIIANDATVKGGTLFPETVQKHVRAQVIAGENRLPCLYLVDSGGAFLPLQDEVFPGKDHFGNTFYNQSRLSAAGLPQISVVLGGCTAGGAYVPALSDEVVIVRGIGRIFLGGPPIVKAALKEIVDPETLGGAELHTYKSGVSDLIAENEDEAYRMVRGMFEKMHWPRTSTFQRQPARAPLYDTEELTGVVPADYRIGYDVREVIARLVDASEFQEFKPLYGNTIVTGFAHIHGYPVGVVANNGILFSTSALKATHFIEMCNQRGTPLVFLQNTTGYMVGRQSEEGGIAKDGAKMVAAVACSTVPKFTVLIGASYGAGNYGMCGRGFAPRFLFSWPNSRIATMSADTAETVMVDVRVAGLKGKDVTEAELNELRRSTREQYERHSDPYYATSRLWDDGIIEPGQTRDVLGLCLALADRVPPDPPRFRVFRM